MKIFADSKEYHFEYDSDIRDGRKTLKKSGKPVSYELVKLGPDRYSLLVDNKSYVFSTHANEHATEITLAAETYLIKVEDERLRALNKLVRLSQSGSRTQELNAPIPGLVVQIRVKAGDIVSKDDGLLVLEAMKMENVIKAPFSGEVVEVAAVEKQSVHKGQLLIRLKNTDG